MEQFRSAGIPAAIRTNAGVMSETLLGQAPAEHHVLIDGSDFPRAHALLDAEAKSLVASVGDDHPLHTFTNEELMEVLAKPHEWTPLDVRLAQHLLTEQGVPLSEWIVSDLNARSVSRMSEHDRGSTMLIIIGVLISLALPGLAYLRFDRPLLVACLLLMCLLWHINRSSKTVADGSTMMRYDRRERSIAMVMMVVCAIALLTTLWRITIQ